MQDTSIGRGPSVIALALIATTASTGVLAQEPFETPDLAAGEAPTAVQLGDVDGDGLPDLLVRAQTPGSSGSLFLGQLGGTFGEPIPLLVPGNFGDILLADVDGDGADELVYADGGFSGGVHVTVLEWEGTGFGSPKVAATTSVVGDLEAVDVNRDGLMDVLAAHNLDARVSVLLGQRDGSLALTAQLAVDQRPYDIAAGDVNGDGLLDVAALCRAPTWVETRLVIAIGQAQGWAPPELLDETSPLESLRVTDLDGDGFDDVAVKDIPGLTGMFTGPQNVRIYRGGSTGLAAQPQLVTSPERFKTWTPADMDDDGDVDLVLAMIDTDNLWVFEAQGDTWVPGARLGQAGGAPFDVLAADVDLDGTTDLVAMNLETSVRVHRGTGEGTWLPAIGVANSVDFEMSDVTGDGLVDAIAISLTDTLIELHPGLPGRAFGAPMTVDMLFETRLVATADVDGDGVRDLVATVFDFGGSSATGGVSVALGNGAGGFLPAVFTGTGELPSSMDVADLDGDGDDEIVTTTLVPAGLRVLDHVGAGALSTMSLTQSGIFVGVLALGDMTSDGVPDAVFTNGNGITILPGLGNGNFGPGIQEPLGAHFTFVTLADVDADGWLDVVTGVSFQTPGALWILPGDGAGGLLDFVMLPSQASVSDAEVLDSNGDGILDIVTSERTSVAGQVPGGVSVLLGQGGLSFAPPQRTPLANEALGLEVVDVDEDGVADAVVRGPSQVLVLPSSDGVWQPLGQSLAGSAGHSQLEGIGPLSAGSTVTLRASGGPALASAFLVAGFNKLSAPFHGGVLVPSPDVIVDALVTDAAGVLELAGSIPAGLSAGTTLYFQTWFRDADAPGNLASTGAVAGTTP